MNIRTFYTITFVLAVILAFMSPPFIFGGMQFASREFRMIFGLIVIMLLIVRIAKLSIYDLLVSLCVAVLFAVEMLRQASELNNILSYYAVVVFYVLLFITLRNSELSRETFLKLWIRIAYFVSISSIILFVLHQFTSFNTDFFNFAPLGDFSAHDRRFSFLGLTQAKNFGFFTIVRSYSYFVEPQYAAFYFLINLLLAQELNKHRNHRSFFVLNLLAGLLTFSMTFYIAMVIVYMMRLIMFRSRNVFVSFIFVNLAVAVLILSVLGFIFDDRTFLDLFAFSSELNTSYGDRELRLLIALNILRYSSPFEWLFGHGVGYIGGADRGLAAGFFHVLVERGLTGLLFVLGMLTVFIKRNFVVYLVCVLYLFAFTWYVNYIFWMGILALWVGVSVAKSRMLSVKECSIPGNDGGYVLA